MVMSYVNNRIPEIIQMHETRNAIGNKPYYLTSKNC